MTAGASLHPAPAARGVTLAALWFGLFGAPAAWSLQLLVSYALVAHGCYPRSVPLTAPLVGGVRTIALVASLAALAVGLAAGATAWRSWRASCHEHRGDHSALLEIGEGRTRFMALAGMLVAAVFLLAIVMNAVPLFLVPACA
jgi:hypothetical protein